MTDDDESAISEFLHNCHVLLVDEDIERQAIRLRRNGHCKLPDAIIAATAQVHQLTLLTLDQRLEKLTGQFEGMK